MTITFPNYETSDQQKKKKDCKYTEENPLHILMCKSHLPKLRLPRIFGI